MARRLLTLDEVVEEVQKSDSEDERSGNEDEVSGNEDESEDDFDGYIYEEEVGQRWEMESDGDVQGNGVIKFWGPHENGAPWGPRILILWGPQRENRAPSRRAGGEFGTIIPNSNVRTCQAQYKRTAEEQ